MNLNKKILFVTSMLTLVLYGSSVIYGFEFNVNKSRTEDSQRGYYKRNKDNQTYGTYISDDEGNPISEPELMGVEGVGGVEGYVKKHDLYDKSFDPKTPEEFVRYVEEREKRGSRVIPVYESDGTTVIGEYVVQ